MKAPRKKGPKKAYKGYPLHCGTCGRPFFEEYLGKHILKDHAILVTPPLDDPAWRKTITTLSGTQRPSPSPGGNAHVEWQDNVNNLRLLKEVVVAGEVSNWYLLLPVGGVTSTGSPTSLARDSYEQLTTEIKEIYRMATKKKATKEQAEGDGTKAKRGVAATYLTFGQALSTVFATLGFNLMTPKDMVEFARANGDDDLGARMAPDTSEGLEILRRIKKLANDCAWHGRLHLPQSEKDRLGIVIQTKPSVQLATLTPAQLATALKFKVNPYVSATERKEAKAKVKAARAAKSAEREQAKKTKAAERAVDKKAKLEAKEAKLVEEAAKANAESSEG